MKSVKSSAFRHIIRRDDMNQTKYQALLLGTDPKLADAVALVIRLDGASIGFAGNYADALRALQNQPPELVLLDLKTAGGGQR